MQGYSWEPSRWDIEARRAAAKAIESARPGASFEELKAMAAAALRPLVAEFEHQQRCARIINGTSLSGATSDEQDEAKQAVADALAPLTIGTSEKEMESARDAALGPFRQRILQREADAHRAHLRRLDQAMRENIIAWASIPWGLPPEDKQRTVAAAQKAIDGLPEGTERRELEGGAGQQKVCRRVPPPPRGSLRGAGRQLEPDLPLPQ
ncbi:MAG: hypothetical protein DMG57_32530 [Acidobacteria bacterium]|nr:MAG: hypothetical protein DMG57_32530 [Acidobacteriota bacterium]